MRPALGDVGVAWDRQGQMGPVGSGTNASDFRGGCRAGSEPAGREGSLRMAGVLGMSLEGADPRHSRAGC